MKINITITNKEKQAWINYKGSSRTIKINKSDGSFIVVNKKGFKVYTNVKELEIIINFLNKIKQQ